MHCETIERLQPQLPVAEAAGAQAPVSLWEQLKEKMAAAGEKAPALMDDMELLAQFYDEPRIEEIKINRPGRVDIIDGVKGRYSVEDPKFDFKWCLRFAKRLANFSGQSIDEKDPILYATLPTGDRCTVLIPPAVLPETAAIVIRREYPIDLSISDYEEQGAFSMVRDATKADLLPYQQELLKLKNERRFAEFLRAAIKYRLNGLISGGSGSGKTTLLKAFIREIAEDMRLGSIENVDELKLRRTHPDSLAMFYSLNGQGKSNVTAGDLMSACQRLRFDSVFLAELISPDEGFYFLDSVGTDMPGCWSTTHANTPSGAVDRVTTLIRRSEHGKVMTAKEIHDFIYKSLDVIIQFNNVNGVRRITDIYYDPEYKRSLEIAR